MEKETFYTYLKTPIILLACSFLCFIIYLFNNNYLFFQTYNKSSQKEVIYEEEKVIKEIVENLNKDTNVSNERISIENENLILNSEQVPENIDKEKIITENEIQILSELSEDKQLEYINNNISNLKIKIDNKINKFKIKSLKDKEEFINNYNLKIQDIQLNFNLYPDVTREKMEYLRIQFELENEEKDKVRKKILGDFYQKLFLLEQLLINKDLIKNHEDKNELIKFFISL